MDQEISVSEFLKKLLEISAPLKAIDLPLLDAHGATLADDIFAGERLVLRKGSRIRSTQIGLAASIGLDRLPTLPHPRVVVISAGDDLVEPGAKLVSPEDEFETNSWMLTTAVKEAGAMGYRVHTIPESSEELRRVIEDQLVRADLIVISGESHDESFDLITSTLADIAEPDGITCVSPLLAEGGRHNFGLIGPDRTPVITLPGDPVAAYISAELFVRPMIRTMLGASHIHRSIVQARLTEDLNSPQGKTSLVRGRVFSDSEIRVSPLPDQTEIFTLSDAQGLIAISAESAGAAAGELVDVMVLERTT